MMLVACVGGLAVALHVSVPNLAIWAHYGQSDSQLLHLAQSVTVKVLSKDSWGSGILIQKQGKVYSVLTNEHVLIAGDPPYRIQTPDGQIYNAELVKTAQFQENDLSLLHFRSTKTVYAVALLGAAPLQGDEVFAGGFPLAVEKSTSGLQEFVFTRGKVSLVLHKALEGGYQIGYTNKVENGMSGGPVLNRRGEVVAINGMHAYPLWGDPYVFQDGSHPGASMRQVMIRSSWAIPISTAVRPVLSKMRTKVLTTNILMGE